MSMKNKTSYQNISKNNIAIILYPEGTIRYFDVISTICP